MAHNLNEKNGKTAFFSVKEKAWHGLGTIVKEAPTSEDAIRLAGLDYEVEKIPLRTQPLIGSDGEPIESIDVPNHFATVRKDTQQSLGVVGNRYTILQNVEAFGFFDSIVGEGSAIFETAGALGDGERIFITAKLPEYIRVAGDDLIEQYLFLTNSHDGTGSITAAFTPVRIVCNNTLNAAMSRISMKISIRHTANASTRLNEAHKLMGITNQLSIEMGELFNQMASKKIVEKDLSEIVIKTIGGDAAYNKIAKGEPMTTRMSNIVSGILEYNEVNETQNMVSTNGTLYGAYNAVTGYFQNVKEYKDAEKHLVSITDGTANHYATQAMKHCLAKL